MSQEITKEQIAAFDADFSAQRANRVAMNAVTNNGLLASAIRREAVEQDVHEYSISLEQGEICNQKQSGRCWMFAALNTLRYQVMKKYNLKPMAKLVSWGQGGVDPKIMGVGPVPASRQAMQKAGLTIDDIDLVEANEAFAAQSIAVARELGFDMSKVNVNGGAISIGHPVGASGARIIVTLLHEMLKRDDAKKGLATLCIGGGQGVATIFEKC